MAKEKKENRGCIKDKIYDPIFVDVARRLKGAGCSNDDIAYALGVYGPSQITTWSKKYPEFKEAIADGREVAKRRLIAKGLHAACGYDYEEVNEKWDPKGIDEDGNPKMILQSVSKFKKHQPANAKILIAFLAAIDPEFRKTLQQAEKGVNKNITVKIDGRLESRKITELAGRLLESTS